MRYVTWKLSWIAGDYGVGPEQIVADNNGRLEASQWVNPTVEKGEILGYLQGDLDIQLISDWKAVELTAEEAVSFAKLLDETAHLHENGLIVSSVPNDPA